MMRIGSRLVKPVPVAMPAIVGDIIHNLRVSLDLLASELVRMNGEDASHVYFPFAKSETELEAMIRSRNMHLAAPDVVDLVRGLRPYTGGNIALRGVHDLDIRDKHVSLIPTPGALLIQDGLPFLSLNKFLGHGGKVSRERLRGSSLELGQAVPLKDFKIIFHLPSPFGDDEMIPTLHRLVQEFSGLLDTFELHLFGALSEELPAV